MIEWLAPFFEKNPELPVFLAIGLGYWIGNLKIRGVGIGPVTGALLAGVLLGNFWKVPVSDTAKAILFLLFMYGIGYSAGPGFVRESVRLERMPSDELETRSFPGSMGPVSASPGPSSGEALDHGSNRQWLTWTLAGLGAAAGLTTVGAIVYREAHARRWNDDSCLAVGQTREQLCGEEREKVETGDAVAITSGIAAGLFAAGAMINAFVFTEPARASQAGLQGCALGPAGASCFGAF